MLWLQYVVASIVALLDSCVIFPMPLVDTLLRSAEKGLYRPHLFQEILDGATRNLVKRGRMTPEKAKRHQCFILNTFPDASVEVPEKLNDLMTNNVGDRHVLAAAVVAKVDVIVTSNLKHFPKESLEPWNIEAQHPDEFLNHLCDLHGDEILYSIILEQAGALKKPPQTALDLLGRFECEQPIFASRMLLHGHSRMIGITARQVLDIVLPEENPGKRCKSGNNYKICEIEKEIVISDKFTSREILRKDGESVTGQPLKKHVLAFEEMKQVVDPRVNRRRLPRKSSSKPFSR
jgi:polyhydroxyalkanoate synthesis regulator phasin